MRKIGLVGLVIGASTAAASYLAFHLYRDLRVAAGRVCHVLASQVFVSGLDPSKVYRESLMPRSVIAPFTRVIHPEVDWRRKEVSVRFAGRVLSRAVYQDGLGCILVHSSLPPDSPPVVATWKDRASSTRVFPEIGGPELVEPEKPQQRALLEHAFREPEQAPHRWTRAIVIVRDGQVVAERYAPGYGMHTPLLGYSTTKSVINALIGILVRQGRLSLEQPAPVKAWSSPGDPRREITISHLLRMTSGLDLDETSHLYDRAVQMLYLERDMAGFAVRRRLKARPGTVWSYSSGNTLILSKIIRDAVGGGASEVLHFAHQELFQPLGMNKVTLEFDAVGTPVGSTYLLAPARDWARFGMLFLNDGLVGAQRILPEGWVRESTRPTLDTGYGAGFWTNGVPGVNPATSMPWGLPGAPMDTFFARGILGQYVIVVPSARLVITRFADAHGKAEDAESVGRLVNEAISAFC